MKHLLPYLSALLLLFALPKSDLLHDAGKTTQSQLKKSCAAAPSKRNCPKKCFRHRAHSAQPAAGTTAISCGQPLYAIVNQGQPEPKNLHLAAPKSAQHPSGRPLPPTLYTDPDPPQPA